MEQILVIQRGELEQLIRNELQSALAGFSPAPPKKTKDILTRKQAARELGISLVTLWKLDKSGELPASRIGVKVIYTREQLEKFLEKNTAVKW